MCKRCLNVVQGHIRYLIGNRIQTATGVPFTIVSFIANRIHVLIDKKTTIVLDWSPWISDKTYYFYIGANTGPETTFTSRPL